MELKMADMREQPYENYYITKNYARYCTERFYDSVVIAALFGIYGILGSIFSQNVCLTGLAGSVCAISGYNAFHWLRERNRAKRL